MDDPRKICTICGEEKNLNEFKSNGKDSCHCRKCENRNRRLQHRENVEQLYLYLLNHPCVDCGERNPLVLTFDHQYDKKENVSDMVRRYIWKSVLKEIDKCEVRCANCHNRKTAEERGTHMCQIVEEFEY